MSFSRIGDIARSLTNRNQTKILKNKQTSLSKELSSGKASDPVRKVKGDTQNWAQFVHAQEIKKNFLNTNKETIQFFGTAQNALESIRAGIENLNSTLVIGPEANQKLVPGIISNHAGSVIENVMSGLNTSVAGQFIFGGAKTTNAPLVDSKQMLAALDSAVLGLTSTADVLAAVDSFFSPGGDFDTNIYQGDSDDMSPIKISENESVAMDWRADDGAFSSAIKAAAIAYVSGSGSASISTQQKLEILEVSRTESLNSETKILEVVGHVGVIQERLENTQVRLKKEVDMLETAHANILSIDNFEVATRLQDVNLRLEMLYASTAQVSRLSLLDYLR